MDLVRDFRELFSLTALLSILMLTGLEIVLGVDNIIFVSIAAGKLPRPQQGKARSVGLSLALIFRIGILLSIKWLMGMKVPLFTVFSFAATGRDLILFTGGVFLLYKTIREIFDKINGSFKEETTEVNKVSLSSITLQILFIDIVFSFDSILTAISLVSNVLIMIVAVILSMLLMLWTSEKVSDFINHHPAIKMLALSFLLMIGSLLIMDACHFNVDRLKPILYYIVGLALLIELLRMWVRKNKKKV